MMTPVVSHFKVNQFQNATYSWQCLLNLGDICSGEDRI